mmetsp:Transcript_3095/g.6398  ORF Transcript_3095/g.6398 Transcript_3095/m.6398 type:complete len:232 (-) Transcript_3095:1093-1788(-)
MMAFSFSSSSFLCFKCKIVESDLAFMSSFSDPCFNKRTLVFIKLSLSFSARSCLSFAWSLLRTAAATSFLSLRYSCFSFSSLCSLPLELSEEVFFENEACGDVTDSISFALAADFSANIFAFLVFRSSILLCKVSFILYASASVARRVSTLPAASIDWRSLLSNSAIFLALLKEPLAESPSDEMGTESDSENVESSSFHLRSCFPSISKMVFFTSSRSPLVTAHFCRIFSP